MSPRVAAYNGSGQFQPLGEICSQQIARELERLGRTASRLFSISTAGSIFGTFATEGALPAQNVLESNWAGLRASSPLALDLRQATDSLLVG